MPDIENYAGNATLTAIERMAAGRSTVMSTVTGDSFADRLTVYNAINNSVPLADNLNKTIEVADFVIQPIDLADEETGEVRSVARTVIIATDGTAYHAISAVVFRDVQNIIGILGKPGSWDEPLKVKTVRNGSGTRKFMTLVPVIGK